MFCSNCGNKIEEGGVYCSICGSPINAQNKPVVEGDTQSTVSENASVTQPVNKQYKSILSTVFFIASVGFYLIAALIQAIGLLGYFDERSTMYVLDFVFLLFACGTSVVSFVFGIKESRGYKILFSVNLMYMTINFITAMITMIYYYSKT